MNISALSIRNPVPAILLFVMLSGLGLLAFSWLPVQNFPDMDLPTINISATLQGAAPDQLESQVARKIEDKLPGLTQLDHITTKITDGMVSIVVTFKVGKDPQTALNEVKNAVDSAQSELPPEMSAPQVTKSSVAASPMITYALTSDRLDETELSWFVDNDLTKMLNSVDGVGEIDRVGGITREVKVQVNQDVLHSLNMSVSDINAALKNVQADTSGGQAYVGGQSQSIRTLGAVPTIHDLSEVTIPLSTGARIRLDEIGTIKDGHADRASLAWLDGKSVIAAEVKRSKGYSDVGVTKAIRAAMATFAAAHPDVHFQEAYNTVAPTIENYNGSMDMLYEGAVIAIFVVFLFLRNWRATILASTALPLSIIPTFLAMYFFDFSLNTISLLALSLVVGVLVDDAIVEVENISRHLAMGKSPLDAALEAADEIGLAVIATTFTLVAVFLPTAFMAGIPGLIFKQFGGTAAVAVLSSLLVARLLTPMMAAYILKPAKVSDEKDGWIMRNYLRAIHFTLTHRLLTLLLVVVFLGLSGLAITQLQVSFLPASDNAQTQIKLTAAPGTTLKETDALARRAVDLIKNVDGLKSTFISTGTTSGGGSLGGTTSKAVNTATIVADLLPIGKRSKSQTMIEGEMRDRLSNLPGVQVQVGDGGNGTQLQLTLSGDDSTLITQSASALEEQLRTLKGIGSVRSSDSLQAPEVQIRPNFSRAAALGITSQAISDAIRVATAGDYSQQLSKLNLPQRQVDIRVELGGNAHLSLDDIKSIQLKGNNGLVPLDSIAQVSIGGGPSEIDRLDRSRNITLTVELNGLAIGEVNAAATKLPAYQNLPKGIKFVQQGELQRTSELFSSFALAMGIGVFCIYAVLVLLFHDFLQPVTILTALPLSLGGAMLPLVLTGTPFSMPVVIGMLMLMGIASKNSILLVEYAITARRHGASRIDALIDACHKRARPIVMTTIAMGGGMLPVALSLSGGDSSFRQPMGIVVIGGLITSTILSLLVIPVVFTYIDDLLNLLKRPFVGKALNDADQFGNEVQS